MSLSASMWTSVSGLLAHGEKMNVVGNNISNVNTVGFKAQRMDFQDFVYQYVGTANGMGQVGRGTSIGIIMNDYGQGSFETSTSATDIAISGEGFFAVKPKTNNTNFYTRAGNFTFDKDGYLVDPHNYVLQGWKIDNTAAGSASASQSSSGIVGTGTPVDVMLDTFTCPPRHTTNVTMKVNLAATDATANDKSHTDATNPFTSLLQTWNADQGAGIPPIGADRYAYQSTVEVYDEGGRMHKLTIYFDRVTPDPLTQPITNASASEGYWEYMITMDPADDVRDFASAVGDISTTPNVPDRLKGILGAGTMTFNGSGQMKDMTCFVPQGSPWWSGAAGAETVNLNSFVAAPISTNGYPMISPNFSGEAGLANAYRPGDYTQPNPDASGRMIEFNFGLKDERNTWAFPATTPTTGVGGLVSLIDVGNDKQNANGLDGFGELQNEAITQYDKNFNEKFAAQDGYTFGDLRYVTVSPNGVLSGAYSNGVTLQLYQITLYDFPSKQNLRREGGNLFTETRESGLHTSGAAGTGIFGTTQSNSLEQSNVDLSREFVNMITTQRGFQANSKTITTVDTMLDTVISMKR